MRHKGTKGRKMKCLKCDKLFETTPEFRLCTNCKALIKKTGADSGYDSNGSGFFSEAHFKHAGAV